MKADSVAAGALWAEEGTCVAGMHEQRFIGGSRLCLQVPAYPDASRTRPLYGSSRQSPLSRELPAWRPTAGTARDHKTTGWQAVLTRSVNCACPAAPAANLR
jgi:hypothetical protein